MICPLCTSSSQDLYHRDKTRSYFKCSTCELVFVPRDELISPDQEKARYESHENSEDDSGYREYLGKIAASIIPHLEEKDAGLDFGSGKTKLLAELLKPHHVESYDIFFHPANDLLEKTYQFIIMSEVIEHLREPHIVLEKLKSLLTPAGKLFIKTKFYPDQQKFADWFYKRDITHVQFFNEHSFKQITQSCEQIGEDLWLLRNN
jgi:SAM-dependent methyltransferase